MYFNRLALQTKLIIIIQLKYHWKCEDKHLYILVIRNIWPNYSNLNDLYPTIILADYLTYSAICSVAFRTVFGAVITLSCRLILNFKNLLSADQEMFLTSKHMFSVPSYCWRWCLLMFFLSVLWFIWLFPLVWYFAFVLPLSCLNNSILYRNTHHCKQGRIQQHCQDISLLKIDFLIYWKKTSLRVNYNKYIEMKNIICLVISIQNKLLLKLFFYFFFFLYIYFFK